MISRKQRRRNLKIVKKLAEKKNWQVDWSVAQEAIGKENPRFFYFPFQTADGQKRFFKSSLLGKKDLYQRIVKEFKLQQWLGELGGPVKEITDFGQEKGIFWYATVDVLAEPGVIFNQEFISGLKKSQVKMVTSQLDWLWRLRRERIPTDLFKDLYPFNPWFNFFRATQGEVKRYLKILRPALKTNRFPWWQDGEERGVTLFFKNLKREARSFEKKEGILVHGDLAPNNIFFGRKKIVILDWEGAYWCRNLLLGAGLDVANFYTRCWEKPQLGELFLQGVRKTSLGQKDFFLQALRVGLILSVLQKMAPMFKLGFYRKRYDRHHLDFLIKTLKESLKDVV